MHIVRVTAHPTSADLILAKTPPAMAAIMGRFEPARWSAELSGYLIAMSDLDSFGRFLRFHSVAVSDERNTGTRTAPKFVREPFACIKCYDCDYTQRECDDEDGGCGDCRCCHNCGGQSLGAYVIDADEQREINGRGLVKVRPLLRGWPLPIDAEPALAAARAAHTPTKEADDA